MGRVQQSFFDNIMSKMKVRKISIKVCLLLAEPGDLIKSSDNEFEIRSQLKLLRQTGALSENDDSFVEDEVQKCIDKIILQRKETKSRWKCLFQAHSGDLIKNLKF